MNTYYAIKMTAHDHIRDLHQQKAQINQAALAREGEKPEPQTPSRRPLLTTMIAFLQNLFPRRPQIVVIVDAAKAEEYCQRRTQLG